MLAATSATAVSNAARQAPGGAPPRRATATQKRARASCTSWSRSAEAGTSIATRVSGRRAPGGRGAPSGGGAGPGLIPGSGGREGVFDGRVGAEHPIEGGQLQDGQGLLPGPGEAQVPPGGARGLEPPDQGAEARAVDEAHPL